MTYVVAFAGGLLGSVHCLGMCGGFPLALARTRAGLRTQLLYNLGRLNSLLFLGVASGALGAAIVALGEPFPLQRILAASAGLWMVVIGLERLGLVRPVSAGLGAVVARGLGGPLRAAVSLRSPAAPLLVGAMNELLPCHLVYVFAVQAAASGSPAGGALVMVAFALGTLPAMLGLGIGAARLEPRSRHRVECVIALVLLAYGGLLLASVFSPAPHLHPTA